VPAHAIRDCHQQWAILNREKTRLTLSRNTFAIQREDQMIVLVVAPAPADIGDVSDTCAQAKDTFLLTTYGRYLWGKIRHRENLSPSPVCV
jgi:hypothetical protein